LMACRDRKLFCPYRPQVRSPHFVPSGNPESLFQNFHRFFYSRSLKNNGMQSLDQLCRVLMLKNIAADGDALSSGLE